MTAGMRISDLYQILKMFWDIHKSEAGYGYCYALILIQIDKYLPVMSKCNFLLFGAGLCHL